MRTIEHWIDNAPTAGDDRRHGPVFDPSTGQQVAQVGLAGQGDVDRAVDAAHRAFPSWAETSLSRRAKILFAFRELVDAHADELARIVSREHGKVLSDAHGEVQRGLEVVEFCCGIPTLLKGEYTDQASTGVDSFSFRQPLGVVAGVTPFNFPVMVPMWMHPVAIACGNTFVLKPSERDPSASVRVAELWSEAGLPDGVFNVVHGDRITVDALLDHEGIEAISFVGSTPIARSIHQRASQQGKRVQALGGAKNHAIVLPDADIDLASDHLASAAFGSAGERCMAVSAAVAVGHAADGLAQRLDRTTRAIRVGPGDDPASDMGPLVTAEARERVLAFIDSAESQGATIRVDGRELVVAGRENGFFVGPTVVDDVTTRMDVYGGEVFGPVLSMLRVDSLSDAIELVNANPYGNGAAVFTNSGGAARRFARDVGAGMVGINVPVPVPMAYHSFGGWKQSLFGDLHVHGREGITFYTRSKVVTSRWPDVDTARSPTFDFPSSA